MKMIHSSKIKTCVFVMTSAKVFPGICKVISFGTSDQVIARYTLCKHANVFSN